MQIKPEASVWLPIATVSEANRASHEHYRVRAKRAKDQNEAVILTMRSVRSSWDFVRLPLVVVLTRYSVGVLDDDNLPAALKHVQDGVCDALGLVLPKGEGPRKHSERAPGFKKPAGHFDDRDRLSWQYAQRKCKRGDEGVRVSLYRPGAVARHLLSVPRETLDAWLVENASAFDEMLCGMVPR